jgi:hypothetical protein
MKNKTPKVPPGKKTGKTEKKEFPGYPLYPPSDDITHHAKKVPADLEDSSLQENNPVLNVPRTGNKATGQDDEGKADGPESEFDVTPEDLEALGPKDLSMDMGEDEELKHRSAPVDFSGEDLDVPGSEDDDLSEAAGSEDEENNSYSIGGDRHEDLEEDRS